MALHQVFHCPEALFGLTGDGDPGISVRYTPPDDVIGDFGAPIVFRWQPGESDPLRADLLKLNGSRGRTGTTWRNDISSHLMWHVTFDNKVTKLDNEKCLGLTTSHRRLPNMLVKNWRLRLELTKHVEPHLLGRFAKAVGGHKRVKASIGAFALLYQQRAAVVRHHLVDMFIVGDLHLAVGLVGRGLVPSESGERAAAYPGHNADVTALLGLHELLQLDGWSAWRCGAKSQKINNSGICVLVNFILDWK